MSEEIPYAQPVKQQQQYTAPAGAAVPTVVYYQSPSQQPSQYTDWELERARRYEAEMEARRDAQESEGCLWLTTLLSLCLCCFLI